MNARTESGVTAPGLRFYGPYMPLFLGLFFCHFGIGATLSVLPFYVKDRLGGGDVSVGTVIAAIAVAVVITRPIAGRLSDRRKKYLCMNSEILRVEQ